MRLTRGSDYGAHAVIELASHYGQGPLQCAEIAARQKIPEAYLDQILSSLRRVGIVKSSRGPHGGHEPARDARHITLPEVGSIGQRKLLAAKVLLIGAGGLGSPAAMYLAAAGVGTIGIVDYDVVELSNLHRQIIHGHHNLGMAKVDSVRERLADVN